MVPTSLRRVSLAVLGALALAGVAAAQGQQFTDPEVVTGTSPLVRFVGGFLGNLLVGGILVAVAPSFTKRVMATAREDAILAFVYGLATAITAVVVTFILAATGIGLILAIPLIFALAVVGIVGGAAAFVLVGSLALEASGESEPGLGRSVVVGALAAGVFSAIPIVGGLAEFVVGTVGLGALVVRWRQ